MFLQSWVVYATTTTGSLDVRAKSTLSAKRSHWKPSFVLNVSRNRSHVCDLEQRQSVPAIFILLEPCMFFGLLRECLSPRRHRFIHRHAANHGPVSRISHMQAAIVPCFWTHFEASTFNLQPSTSKPRTSKFDNEHFPTLPPSGVYS